MPTSPEQARAARRRHLPMAAGALVAGALEAAHTLAWGGRLGAWSTGFTALSVLIELEVLTVVFDRGRRANRSPAWSFVVSSAVAAGVGMAESFAAWMLERYAGLLLLGAMRITRASVVAEMGAFNGLLGLGLWAMAVVVPFAVRDANARAIEAEQLRTAAELARLRAHLQPHFLLNTLSTVAGLVVEDPSEARNLVAALGDLLRDATEDADEMQTLDDEVRWLRRYAEILETRHRGSLRFVWDIAEATRGVRVPRLLLQPLLENAVKHGALRRREGGEVTVRTAMEPDGSGRLRCVVEDNGPGPGSRGPREGAMGLTLVTRRLALKYGAQAKFRLEADQGRTRSVVEIPVGAAP